MRNDNEKGAARRTRKMYREKEIKRIKGEIAMMEIKFRAWNKCHEFMMEEVELIDFRNQRVKYDSEWWENDSIEIMQYTGMKDTNDKEIYEGDIVRLVYDGAVYTYQVVFDLSELDFKATNGNENYKNHFLYPTCCECVEIIGNIYENPELEEWFS